MPWKCDCSRPQTAVSLLMDVIWSVSCSPRLSLVCTTLLLCLESWLVVLRWRLKKQGGASSSESEMKTRTRLSYHTFQKPRLTWSSNHCNFGRCSLDLISNCWGAILASDKLWNRSLQNVNCGCSASWVSLETQGMITTGKNLQCWLEHLNVVSRETLLKQHKRYGCSSQVILLMFKLKQQLV